MKAYYLKNKIYVGISGHRDLKKSNKDKYREQIKTILLKLVKENSEKEVIVLSPLADGADRLMVDAAVELGLRYEVLLPMVSTLYQKDFSVSSLEEYKILIMNARDIPSVVALCDNCTEENITEYGAYRDRQYLKVGQEIVERSDMIVFLWDKKHSKGVGGTADIVSYAKIKDKSYIIVVCEREKRVGWMTDILKFQCMIGKYRDVYEHYEVFAQKIGASPKGVNKWELGQGNKLQQKSRERICAGFRLKYEVWEDHYYTEQEFMKHLDTYLNVDHTMPIWEEKEKVFFDDIIHMTPDEKKQIREVLSLQNPISLPGNLEEYSPDFMLALTGLLKDNHQTEDALRVTETLLASDTLYKAKYYNKIQHLKAILLSSDKIRDWDAAIDILNLLYFSARYHLEDPEILTLIASNYKRKALYSTRGKLNPPDSDYIDMDLLGKALASYRESYGLKKQDKYYDAINIAYLVGLLSTLEKDDDAIDYKDEIKALRDELHVDGWRVNDDNWWEVATEIEFLVLMGKVSDAMVKLNAYLEWNQEELKKFDIETTIRQMELYVHFTDDENVKAFLSEIKDNWDSIQKFG